MSTLRAAVALIFLAPALAGLAPTAGAATEEAQPWDDVVVAVLDSGIRPDHKAFEAGQIVAWRDFVNGQPTPYDDPGHGTAVASMVGGDLAGLTPSHAPGVKLAVGKVLSAENGAYWTDVTAAIHWAVDTVQADVITLSVYNYGISVGGPGYSASSRDLLDAIEYARDSGVLVTILAGNGQSNAGIPSMSYFHVPSVSGHALIVGGAGFGGLVPTAPLGDMEAEVVADYTVTVACHDGAACSKRASGTSYSTPLVAGAAARLIGVAREMGITLTPDELEDIIKKNAVDGPAPPTLEGYGYVGAVAVANAEAHLRNGTPHGGPTTAVNALYVEEVQRRQRDAWRDGLP